MALVDNENLKELSECVENLTHSGEKTLDPNVLKRLKGICRLSNKYIEHAFHLITHQLDKHHAEIRYSSFQVCNELFRRSHRFRELVVNDMQHIMEMTAETSPDLPLPLPRAAALDLKRFALRTIHEWNMEFGEGYKKLQIGYNFLKHCQKVDFNALNNESLLEQARIQERERRQSAVNQNKFQRVTAEMNDMLPEITNTITAIQNCLSLLIPKPENFFIPDSSVDIESGQIPGEELAIPGPSGSTLATVEEDLCSDYNEQGSDSESQSEEINFREFGILNGHHTVALNINLDVKLRETDENASIFENGRDLFRLLNNRYLPCIKKWVKVMSKISDTASTDKLKKLMDLKKMVENEINKCIKLNLQKRSCDESSSSDSDFEEVAEKEGYEETAKVDAVIFATGKIDDNTAKSKKSSWNICSQENYKDDPTTPLSTLTSLTATKAMKVASYIATTRKTSNYNKNPTITKDVEPRPSTSKDVEPRPSTSKDVESSRKAKLLSMAPKLPFDVDLYHWEDEKVPIPTMLAVRAEGSQIWSARPSEGLDEIPVPEDMASSLRTRVIEYSGKFEPVKWACRAILPNGKLCPRRDRYKCPFHGIIVPRDETGQFSRPEDAAKVQKLAEEEQIKHPDWQDPQLLEEIKAATGIDLKMPEKGKRKKNKQFKKKYPGLTDLKAKQNTSHNRLAKKVFKKSAMKRIASALDNLDHKRFRDKYGDQFHYMYNTA